MSNMQILSVANVTVRSDLQAQQTHAFDRIPATDEVNVRLRAGRRAIVPAKILCNTASVLDCPGSGIRFREVGPHNQSDQCARSRLHDTEFVDDARNGAGSECPAGKPKHTDPVPLAEVVDQELVAATNAVIHTVRECQTNNSAEFFLDAVPETHGREIVGRSYARVVIHQLTVVLL